MPRTGGNYSLPFPDVVPNTTIESAKYNGTNHDIEFDLNQPRPVASGGTGGTSPDTALVGISAEKANQAVTNFDTQVWIPGSFSATTAASGAPVTGHAFTGIAYVGDPIATPQLNLNVTVEARDQSGTTTPGLKYVRQKIAGVWGAWMLDGQGSFVAKAGDTMTGNLIINPAPAVTPVYGTGQLTVAKNSGAYIELTTGINATLIGSDTTGGSIGANSNFNIRTNNVSHINVDPTGYINMGDLTVNRVFSIAALSVRDSSHGYIEVTNGTASTVIGADVGGSFIGSYPATQFALRTNNAVRVTVQAGGRVIVGDPAVSTIFSSGGLSVVGSAAYTELSDGTRSMYSGADAGGTFVGSYTSHLLGFRTGAARRAYFDVNGSFYFESTGGAQPYKPGGGPWWDSSDARTKTVLGDYTKGLADITQLRPVSYTFDGADASPHGGHVPDGRVYIGLVAQEVEGVMPEMVSQIDGFVDGIPVDDMRTLDTGALIYALVNACKELKARIEALEAA
jgi:hypothetical protein